MSYKITNKELIFLAIIGIAGFFFSSIGYIKHLDTLSPYYGLLSYYLIWYGALFILSHKKFIIWNFKIGNPSQVLGMLLIIFAVGIILNFESPYVQYVTKGNFEGASNIFFQSEDGITWIFFQDVMGINNIESLRILTFVVTPLILSLIGVYLVSRITL